MMALDNRGFILTALYYVGIYCALNEIIHFADFLSFSLEYFDKFGAYNLTFALGGPHALQLAYKVVACIRLDDIHAHISCEHSHDFVRFSVS